MKRISFLLCLMLLLSALPGCGKQPGQITDIAVSDLSENVSGSAEYVLSDPALKSDFVSSDNYRVFYEIFVGSFSDSNGDGTGDLRGIIDRMDYLNDGDPNSGLSLGIEGIWLTPVFRSPSYHKYDVTDYYSVDPSFGTLDDLRELFKVCHERNVKVILDLPINHTGSQCEWFRLFCDAHRNGDRESNYYDFYNWLPGGAPTEGRTFRQIPNCHDEYECNFSGDMPELNFDNELVRQALLEVARFYLDLGADGFRFDAAKYVYLGDNGKSADFWLWYLKELRGGYPDIYTVAEVWDSDSVTDVYCSATNCFNFSMSQPEGLIASAAKSGNIDNLTSYVQDYLDRVHSINTSAMIVPFITNHDQDRAAGFLSPGGGSMQMAANLYLLGPGSPFIYYGEELGMRGSRGGADTDANRRLAMVWNDGDTVKDPQGSSYNKQIEAGVSEQRLDEDSLYNYYKRLLMIRNANPEIARGVYKTVSIVGTKMGGFTAFWRGTSVCVLHNATDSEVRINLEEAGLEYTEIRASAGMNGAVLEGTVLTVGAMTSVVLK